MSRALSVMLVIVQAALVLGAACPDSSGAPVAGAPGGAEGGAAGDPGGVGGESKDGTGGLADGGGGGGGGSGGTPWTEARLRLPPEHAWLDDPALWKLLPSDERLPWSSTCAVFEANEEDLRFPPIAWESCGTACERADVVQGYSASSNLVRLGTERTAAGNPEAHLAVNHTVHNAADGALAVSRIISLRSGATVAATTARIGAGSSCGPIPNSDSAVGWGRVWFHGPMDEETGVRFDGAWSPSTRSWIWRLPWTNLAEEPFKAHLCDNFIMAEGARYFYICGAGTLWASLERGTSAMSIIHDERTSDYRLSHGTALGDLAIWSENLSDRDDPHARIRGWMPDGQGIRTLIERIEGRVCEVALSETAVAGYLADSCGMYGYGHRVVVAPFEADGTLGELRTSPPITDISMGVGEIRTGGDFVAVRALAATYDTLTEKSPVYLIRMTDWAVRLIDYLPESQASSIALDDGFLYVVHATNKATPIFRGTSHVYRYDLSRFDELGTLIEPPDDGVAEP